jgi:hypothetical protein
MQHRREAIQQQCPYCGQPQAEWTKGDGRGVSIEGKTYCSTDCAFRSQVSVVRIQSVQPIA